MSDTTQPIDRDETSGRFLPGNAGNGGRKPGQRNRLGEAFIADLASSWEKQGATALLRCALEEPATYCKIIASLLPRDISLDVGVSVGLFALSFETALQTLGADQPRPRPKLPGQKVAEVIEHERQRR
jgi:hypothetical protein